MELDGRIGHSEEARFRDYRRDNDASVRGHVTLRYGWTDTTTTVVGLPIRWLRS
ncbi:MAG: hypothetical protein ACRDP8_23645 [Actinopolymorphaceae bacterium]